jgi:2-oxoglutarate dehydrogenase E1 component
VAQALDHHVAQEPLEAVSPLSDLARGRFMRLIPDGRFGPLGDQEPRAVRRALLCSGKIYFELVAQRKAQGDPPVPILRVEQLYPTPIAELRQALEPFRSLEELVWVQEEPRNAGGWMHLWSEVTEKADLSVPLLPVTRPASASPATGSAARHRLEQERVLQSAFGPLDDPRRRK